MFNALPLLALTMGLTSSFHCIGMCGPIALSLPSHKGSKLKQFTALLTYNVGRALTYAALGALLGSVGSALAWAGYLRYFSILAGVFMLAYVLWSKRLETFIRLPLFWRQTIQVIKKSMTKLLQSRRSVGFLLLGILNGLLPCGMVYLALISSLATGSMLSGAIYMFVFGLGTLPAMMAVGFFKQLFTPHFRTRIHQATPILISIAGIWLIARGLMIEIPTQTTGSGSDITVCHGK